MSLSLLLLRLPSLPRLSHHRDDHSYREWQYHRLGCAQSYPAWCCLEHLSQSHHCGQQNQGWCRRRHRCLHQQYDRSGHWSAVSRPRLCHQHGGHPRTAMMSLFTTLPSSTRHYNSCHKYRDRHQHYAGTGTAHLAIHGYITADDISYATVTLMNSNFSLSGRHQLRLCHSFQRHHQWD